MDSSELAKLYSKAFQKNNSALLVFDSSMPRSAHLIYQDKLSIAENYTVEITKESNISYKDLLMNTFQKTDDEIDHKLDFLYTVEIGNKSYCLRVQRTVLRDYLCLIISDFTKTELLQQSLDNLRNILNKQASTIEQKESTIEQKESTIEQKDEVIEQKDEVIEQKDEVIEQKDEVIERKDEVIERKDEVIEQKDEIIETAVSKANYLEDFTAKAIHDLKNPLNGIIGFGQLLRYSQQESSDLESNKYLDMMINSSHTLNNLIDELLHLSKIKNKSFETENVSFSKLIEELKGEFVFATNTLNVVIDVTASIPFIYGEKSLLKSMMRNLISNAIKYSKDNEPPWIKISLKADNANRNRVEIRVEDNGIGIEKSQIENITKPFNRLSHKEKGHGLGLTIFKEIVHKLQGSFVINSKKGVGTVCIITLPDGRAIP